ALREKGLYDDLWIIVVGDHGELFGEHGLKGHGFSLFEETIRCPLIIKWPKGWKNLPQEEEPCQQVDLMPTILNRLRLEPLAPLEGQPLGEVTHAQVCELYRNEGNVTAQGDRFDRDLIALYTGGFKLIRSSRDNDPDAGLFHIETDPGEKQNIARDRPRLADLLAQTLEQWKATRLDPLTPRRIESIDETTEAQLKALGYGH
ncbi:MAG: sulfatase-like hydrolase/transferase, partial [Planctomycetes bacterium]|nr:sulfatase-like hydrolase/transferase [Planctomycetota bacterium]